ncbi:unnamed protein product [Amoebophrya sp. A25]|nr:unnamed protein product [Amoebophrya sp. A25]|eukprot:GSA25T00000240001.1
MKSSSKRSSATTAPTSDQGSSEPPVKKVKKGMKMKKVSRSSGVERDTSGNESATTAPKSACKEWSSPPAVVVEDTPAVILQEQEARTKTKASKEGKKNKVLKKAGKSKKLSAEEEQESLVAKLKKKALNAGASSDDEEAPAPTTPAEDEVASAAASSAGAPATTSTTSPASCAATVYLSGLPYEWTKEDIATLVKDKVGLTKNEDMPKDIRAPTWHDTGRLRGYAHVDFASEALAQTAVKQLHRQKLPSGRWIGAEIAKAEKMTGAGSTAAGSSSALTLADLIKKVRKVRCARLFVGNLPYTVTETEIADLFGGSKMVTAVRIAHEMQRCKGFCYVEFGTCDKAVAALEAVQAKEPGRLWLLGGRRLNIDADTGSGPKAGYHYRKEAWSTGFAVKKNNAPW